MQDSLVKPRTEEKVIALASHMLKRKQADCPVTHHFGPGIYIREVFIPTNTYAIGHYQKTTHLNVMLAGRCVMVNEDGTKTELAAPMTFVSGPGRKVGYIIEDVIWQNIYATEETDIEKLEEMFLEKHDVFKDYQKSQKLLLTVDHSEDNKDFLAAINELGYDADTVRQQSENKLDQIDFPYGNYKVMVSDSLIEGKGLFATGSFEKGEVIAPARINNKRTPAGRFTNHAKKPNAIMVLRDNGDVDLVANEKIEGCKGGQLGQEITVDYRQAVSVSKGRELCRA